MIFSFKELKKIANLHEETSINDVVKVINSIGFEVESVTDFASVSKVKFGKILKITKNPNADKLNVCEIKFQDKKRIIQTSATNVYQGMIVAAFISGSKINNIIFETKEIKGIVSEGMLTNPSEFGINENLLRKKTHDGIYGYKEVSINDDVNEVLGLDDKLIHVDILPNRSDASSYYVMAMEIAACFGTTVSIPNIQIGQEKAIRKVDVNKANAITFIEAKNNFNISIEEELLLAKHGIKSINNAIDLSNLALIHSGLPTHIYDALKVGQQLSVDFSSATVNILGNTKIKLNNNLVVKDETKVISIASVIGLEDTKIENNSDDILIEVGIFSANEIRKSLKIIKIETDASKQGIKNTSHGTLLYALAYLTNKLKNFSDIINLNEVQNKVIKFDENIVNQIAGMQITQTDKYKKAIKSLSSLGFVFNNRNVIIPSYRYDVTTQEDIHEEIFRFYGYENFVPKSPNINTIQVTPFYFFKEKLQAQGYSEVRTYTLVANNKNIINPFRFKDSIRLKTFVSNERAEIRNSQIISLLEIAIYNNKHGFKNIDIFSEGMINNGVKTIAMLSSTKDFYKMQSDIFNLIPDAVFKRLKTDDIHPNIAANIIINDKIIGWIGKVHPRDTKEDYMMAEFIKENYRKIILFQEYNKTPMKYEDINIIIKENEDLEKYLEPYQSKFKVELIDEYKINHERKITIRVYSND